MKYFHCIFSKKKYIKYDIERSIENGSIETLYLDESWLVTGILGRSVVADDNQNQEHYVPGLHFINQSIKRLVSFVFLGWFSIEENLAN